MRTVPLGGAKANGRVALVDDEDHWLVSQYRWHVKERRRRNGSIDGPYAATSVHENGTCRTLRMHTLITGWPEVDHVNHDGLDNQRSNLRAAARSQNGGNSRPALGGTSRFKGVCWNKAQRRWTAYITVDRVRRYLGHFDDEEAAARAYDVAALEAWDEFACLNLAGSVDVSIQLDLVRARPMVPEDRTCCNRGHEYTPENTYIRSDGTRRCRVCRRLIWARDRNQHSARRRAQRALAARIADNSSAEQPAS